MGESAHIIKEMYDCDLLEEDVIVKWYDRVSGEGYLQCVKKGKYLGLMRVVQPFIQWLKDAEEEESEDDGAVVISSTGATGIQNVQTEAPVVQEHEQHEESDVDINIDDI
ncbi:eukaryotic translation initiation factor 5-like [Octopus sinensis]|uniref:Eukaryotic translation initiation factor 5-like n=1 Tax=Octopus sinensis TaxID=2607531 RepID=A0A6P7TVS9_9MOLL|nr:eukaryotic translation initiation factor 5-like [Octopus sinensis]